jgi:hypothetical protein
MKNSAHRSESYKSFLCRKCNLLKLDVLFEHPFVGYVVKGDDHVPYTPFSFQLGSVQKIREKKSCRLCKLIWHALLVQNGGKPPPDQTYRGTTIYVGIQSEIYGTFRIAYVLGGLDSLPKAHAIRLALELTPKHGEKSGLSQTEDLELQNLNRKGVTIQVVDSLNDPSPRPLYGQLVSSTQPNFEAIRKWLRHCILHHLESCNASLPERSISPISVRRLIDIQKEFVINVDRKTGSQRYVTLSYVWAKESFSSY